MRFNEFGNEFDSGDEFESHEPESNESNSETQIEESSGGLGWREKIAKMATEVASREGCEVYDFEFVGSGGSRVLRVYLDKAGGGGVSIDDCSNVSRGLNLLLDVDDVVPGGAYNLEVSSPGLERVLRTPQHFTRAVGGRAQVKSFESFADLNPGLDEALRAKLGKAKQLEGTIRGVEGEGDTAALLFDAENGGNVIAIKVPLKKITKANTVFVFEKQEKKQRK